jgi:hypothetical protein
MIPEAGDLDCRIRDFQAAGTPMSPSAVPNKLHRDGYCRCTRNPMYLGIVVGLLGFAVLCSSMWSHTRRLVSARWRHRGSGPRDWSPRLMASRAIHEKKRTRRWRPGVSMSHRQGVDRGGSTHASPPMPRVRPRRGGIGVRGFPGLLGARRRGGVRRGRSAGAPKCVNEGYASDVGFDPDEWRSVPLRIAVAPMPGCGVRVVVAVGPR